MKKAYTTVIKEITENRTEKFLMYDAKENYSVVNAVAKMREHGWDIKTNRKEPSNLPLHKRPIKVTVIKRGRKIA